MKKIIIWLFSITIIVILFIYWLNPREIYQLNNKTTQFINNQKIPEGTIRTGVVIQFHNNFFHEV